jgi:mannitol-specific phosphotransferase system IIBC component
MWAALVRNVFVFVLTRRGKKVIAFVGAMLLCFLTALLIDWRMYMSAGLAGLLAAAALIAFIVQHLRLRVEKRERARQDIAKAARRAAAGEARSENIQKAKSAFTEAARDASSAAVDVAKTGLAGARDRVSSWRSKDR